MTCPSCGRTDERLISLQRVRDYNGRPRTIEFYSCPVPDCGYSSWEPDDWEWDETLRTDTSEISVAFDRAK